MGIQDLLMVLGNSNNDPTGPTGPGNSSCTDHGQYGSSEAKFCDGWQFTGQLLACFLDIKKI